jgi:hypothetical protein
MVNLAEVSFPTEGTMRRLDLMHMADGFDAFEKLLKLQSVKT